MKIVVAGGFAVGKTTFIQAVSEIPVLATDGWMTETSTEIDDLPGGQSKTRTTVAMDFGRITLAADLRLFLFGTPGQDRFWFLWDGLVRGASASLVLVDTRRLASSFAALTYMEEAGLPVIAAVNTFDGILTHDLAEVRDALGLPDSVPVISCDARDRSSVATALATTVGYALQLAAPTDIPPLWAPAP